MNLPGADPLLILATVLAAGTALGWMAKRIHLPSVTGQIVAGVLIGPSVLGLFDPHAIEGLAPLTHFALALIGVTVGAHLNLARLRNAGRRLFWLLIAEALITPLFVAGPILLLSDAGLPFALLIGTLAVSTAPATVVALVRETRSKGVFVKTLVAAVALNNMACIFLFELAREGGRALLAGSDPSALEVLAGAGASVGAAIFVGASLAVVTHLGTLRVHLPERLATISVMSLLLTYGLASYAEVSPLAACLALGVVQTNLAPSRDRIVDAVFANFEPVILCVFFTLAGLHLSLDNAWAVGGVALLFLIGRSAGKLTSSNLAMRLAGATDRVRRNLGLALIPQAGVAIGLVILVQDDAAFAGIQASFTAVVLTAVTVNEVIGPIATRFALARSGEAGRDHPRLVDFLQEENIETELEAASMEAAIDQLVAALIRSHQLVGVDAEALRRSVLEREARVSTCLGEGLAVPHGELPEGFPMVGVMGLSKRGLPFPTPDGRPVHCVVLLATPKGERDRHLEVLAALARTVGADPAVQAELYNCTSSAHAYEILHGEETEEFNYFLGSDVGND
ncbi:MAG: PTS sugar transporter subunit IIA [Myxococcota bacterium]|nr:PTS sugar transporter subunit IIA [Myxococcota bacterium]